MANRKAPIIKHVHLHNPPIPAPKFNPFTKVLNAVKAWFIGRRKDKLDRRDKVESGEEESHWPSDTDESTFASEIEDGIDD